MSTRNLFAGTVEANSLWVGSNQLDRTPIYKTSTDPNGVVTAPGGALALDDTLGAVWLNVATLGASGSTWTRLQTSGGAAGGDLSGFYPNPLVDGLQGRAVSGVAPAINESLTWNGAAWVPQAVGAGAITAVYGQFYSVVDQTISSGTGISLMYFENTAGANGVSAVDPGTGFKTQLTVAASGKYAFNISPQLLKTAGGGSGLVTFWLRKNGLDVPDSASFVDITNNEHMLPFVEIILDMNAGQYVEWAVNSSVINCRLEHEPESFAPAVVRPAGPSIIAGVKRLGA